MKRKGVTISQLLLIVLILGALGALVIPPFLQHRANLVREQTEYHALVEEYTKGRSDYKKALIRFQNKTGTYFPSDANEAEAEAHLERMEKELALQREAVMGFFEFKAAREKNQN